MPAKTLAWLLVSPTPEARQTADNIKNEIAADGGCSVPVTSGAGGRMAFLRGLFHDFSVSRAVSTERSAAPTNSN
jgi:hypothetical protein